MKHFKDTSEYLQQPRSAASRHRDWGTAKKIVALIPVKNEAVRISFCLKAVASFADAICIYDDDSDDNTLEIIESLSSECRVERVIRNRYWHYDEGKYRQALLDAGREIGGTHFIVLDADEAFTSNLSRNNFLKEMILSLKPGDHLQLVWIQLWRSVAYYRHDRSVWTNNYKSFVFADDGKCTYTDQQFHLLRVPSDLTGRAYRIEGYETGVLHFQFINWRNLLIKQAWYRCLELILNPEKPIDEINRLYAPSKDERDIQLQPANPAWFRYYDFFNAEVLMKSESWRERQIISWFEQYGRDYFAGLDIWDIDWEERANKEALVVKDQISGLVADHMTAEEVEVLKWIEPIGGWMSISELLVLFRLVKALPDESKILEIGSYRGRSTNAIGCAIKHSKKKIYCLDIWQDFDKQGLLNQDSKGHTVPPGDYGVFNDFLKNTNWLDQHLIVLKTSVEKASDFLPKNYFDLIFIDGAHDYENVVRDIGVSISSLKSGGLICGHDYREDGGQDVIRAVQRKIFTNSDFMDYGVFPKTSIWYGQKQFREKKQDLIKLSEKCAVQSSPKEYLISAIVSTYNSERFIRECLDDLEAQTIADQLQIIVVNSGSQQNEAAIIRKFQAKFGNIEYIQTDRRESVYAAWNRAITAAAGKYLTNANTDDRHAAYAFERLAGELEKRNDIALVYADQWMTETVNETFDNFTPVGRFKWQDFDRRTLYDACYIGPQPMWRRTLHEKYGYFDTSFEIAGDWEFWLRISETEDFLHINEFLGLYLKSPESVEHRNPRLLTAESEIIKQRYAERKDRSVTSAPCVAKR
jgi:glycosyltransferase involved in cell wall biosynthesis/predicted O-methyltransferase YrrM